MELILDTSSARLVDPDDHTSFAVVIECDGEPGAAALASGGVVGLGDHAWVRTDALRRLAGPAATIYHVEFGSAPGASASLRNLTDRSRIRGCMFRFLLVRWGYPAELSIGVARNNDGKLEAHACECYAVVKKESDRLLPNRIAS